MTEKSGAKLTTLCYIRREDHILMLFRNKKEQDENEGKWIGVGGKVEPGETPDECVRREVAEETGLTPEEWRFRGIITFVSDLYGTEYMILYDAVSSAGEIDADCVEGELRWILKDDVPALPMWEGDRVFLPRLLNSDELIFLKLVYEGDRLVRVG